MNIDNNNQDYQKLEETFIGPRYQALKNSKFSVLALFLGDTYYFYRKMFFNGLLLEILNILLIEFCLPLYFLVLIILGFITNKLYFLYTHNTISKITSQNPHLSSKDLSLTISKSGGVDSNKAIISLIIKIFSIIILGYLLSFTNINTTWSKFSKAISTSQTPSVIGGEAYETSNKHNSTLTYNYNLHLSEIFDITFPENLTPTDLNDFNHYNYSNNSSTTQELSSCTFELGAITGYDRPQDLLTTIATNNNLSPKFSSKKTNNITWITLTTNNNLEKTYYLSTTKNKKTYLLKYTIGNKANYQVCDNYYQKILKTIKYK